MPLLLGNPFFQSKYSTYGTPNMEITSMHVRRKNAILSDSLADLFSCGCQHEHKGLMGESNVPTTVSYLAIMYNALPIVCAPDMGNS